MQKYRPLIKMLYSLILNENEQQSSLGKKKNSNPHCLYAKTRFIFKFNKKKMQLRLNVMQETLSTILFILKNCLTRKKKAEKTKC